MSRIHVSRPRPARRDDERTTRIVDRDPPRSKCRSRSTSRATSWTVITGSRSPRNSASPTPISRVSGLTRRAEVRPRAEAEHRPPAAEPVALGRRLRLPRPAGRVPARGDGRGAPDGRAPGTGRSKRRTRTSRMAGTSATRSIQCARRYARRSQAAAKAGELGYEDRGQDQVGRLQRAAHRPPAGIPAEADDHEDDRQHGHRQLPRDIVALDEGVVTGPQASHGRDRNRRGSPVASFPTRSCLTPNLTPRAAYFGGQRRTSADGIRAQRGGYEHVSD